MLNQPVEQSRNAARESLILDMKKRKVAKTTNNFNFRGYDLKENGYLNSKTSFGWQPDWPDMPRYARKLNVDVLFKEDRAVIRLLTVTTMTIVHYRKLFLIQQWNVILKERKRFPSRIPFLV